MLKELIEMAVLAVKREKYDQSLASLCGDLTDPRSCSSSAHVPEVFLEHVEVEEFLRTVQVKGNGREFYSK